MFRGSRNFQPWSGVYRDFKWLVSPIGVEVSEVIDAAETYEMQRLRKNALWRLGGITGRWQAPANAVHRLPLTLGDCSS